jgi:O-acetyl-ADP-ribose deacetylase (regulator of RNase III)
MASSPYRQRFANGFTLEMIQGDLTTQAVDAIANAANRGLRHGGGVAAAIVRQGGASIQVESDAWVRQYGPASHERPAWTGAGRLPCHYVIHAVGPVWGEGQEDEKLTATVHGSLETAESLGCASLALPAISTGIFGFPRPRAARVILATLVGWANQREGGCLRLARVVLLDDPAWLDFLDAARETLL